MNRRTHDRSLAGGRKREQLLTSVDGITTWETTWAFPAPLAQMIRSRVDRHRGEDVTASLGRLEESISLADVAS